jgi:C4-dicarboxylate-specific signal transduction histidine kinase
MHCQHQRDQPDEPDNKHNVSKNDNDNRTQAQRRKESRQQRHEDANTKLRSIASSQIQAGELSRQRSVAEANPVEVGESCRGRRSPGQSRKASPVE